jgi:hypothetical protein
LVRIFANDWLLEFELYFDIMDSLLSFSFGSL